MADSNSKGKELLVLEQVPKDLIPLKETLAVHAGDFYDGKLFAMTPIVQDGEELMDALLPEEQNIVRALQACFAHPSSDDFFRLLANISDFFSPFTICVLQNEISNLQSRVSKKQAALATMKNKRVQEGIQSEMEEEVAEFLFTQARSIRMYNHVGESKKEFFKAIQKVLEGVALLTSQVERESHPLELAKDFRAVIQYTEDALDAVFLNMIDPCEEELLEILPEDCKREKEYYVKTRHGSYTNIKASHSGNDNWVSGIRFEGKALFAEQRKEMLAKVEELQGKYPEVFIEHDLDKNFNSFWFITLIAQMPDDEE